MKNRILLAAALLGVVLFLFLSAFGIHLPLRQTTLQAEPGSFIPTSTTTITFVSTSTPNSPQNSSPSKPPLDYSFNVDGTLNEAGKKEQSTSPYWWLNSGGELIIVDQKGETMQGDARSDNIWYKKYAATNPRDTDNGLHPQNLFRLLTKDTWNGFREEAQFYIVKDNFSNSPNRNLSNGLLLFGRYKDAQNLYYAGIRVDGTAVIKKKVDGVYYTMAQKKIFPGTYTSNQDDTNLIPHGEWISLRMDTTTLLGGQVSIGLYMQQGGETSWTKILSAKDNGQYGKTAPIVGPGFVGIRTDFMDVQFDTFHVESL